MKYFLKTVFLLTVVTSICLTVTGCSNHDSSDTDTYDYDSDYSYSGSNSSYSDSNSGSDYDYDKGYGYTPPKEGESLSDYIQRQDPDLYDSLQENWDSLT